MHSTLPNRRRSLPAFVALLSLLLAGAAWGAEKGTFQGTFVVNGVAAKLANIRAKWVPLDDKGTKGVAILLSARPATGDIEDWRTAIPSEKGDYFHIIFDQMGEVWVAELGHTAAKIGRFGVVLEIKKLAYEVKGDRVRAHIHTAREEKFTTDSYAVDLTFDAPIEAK